MSPNPSLESDAAALALGGCTIGSNVRSARKTKVAKGGKKSKMDEELEGGIDILPVFIGLICAGTLATPVVMLMGLKLGMFAAIGGGAMGYTTGKMFTEATGADEEMKAEYHNMNQGQGDKACKIRRRMRRIAEWQKFESNCHRAKLFLDECREREQQEEVEQRGRPRRRARSLGAVGVRRGGEEGKRSLSLPLPAHRLSLPAAPAPGEGQVQAWRGAGARRLTLRASSLPRLQEEAEEDVVSVRSRRRSKSIDSSYNYEVEMVESRL